MSVKKLDQTALNSWVDGLIAKQKVIGVKAKGDRFAYGPLCCASELRLDYDVTLLPPKKLFVPQTEVLATFEAGENYKSVTEDAPFVLMGVHPYDFVAITQMDEVFSKGQYDKHYMTRRNSATIVVSDVQAASPNVFASCMNTATVDSGFDVLLTKIDGAYLVDARTDKGKALTADLASAPDASADDLAAREKVWADNKKALRKHELQCAPTDLPKLLEGAEDHPVWEEKAKLCYSCGSCILVCPTCYCFDVRDDVAWTLDKGQRTRTWDGCMLTSFALVAGGHNFRSDKAERYRHRYYRKGKYLWDRMGHIACVGCGRCITACTANIANPVENYNTLLEDK